MARYINPKYNYILRISICQKKRPITFLDTLSITKNTDKSRIHRRNNTVITIIQKTPPGKTPKKKSTYFRRILKIFITSLTILLMATGLLNIFIRENIGTLLIRKTQELGIALAQPPQFLILPPLSKASMGNENYVLLGTEACPKSYDIPPNCIVFPIHSNQPISLLVKLISTSTHQIAHAEISLKSVTSTSTVLNIEAIATEYNGSIYIKHFTRPYPIISAQAATTEYGGPPPLNMEHPTSNSPKTSTYNL